MKNSVAMKDLPDLPSVIDVVTAGRIFGIGRTTAYNLARRGEFPCPVIRVGGSYRVPTAALLAVLGVEPTILADPVHKPPTSHEERLPDQREASRLPVESRPAR